MASRAARPLPTEIDAIARGYWASRALLTAIELDLFTALGEGATAAEIAARAGTHAAATARLLNALVGLELLAKDGERFRCTPAARDFLAAGGPDDSRASLAHLANLWERWGTLTECLRQGARVSGPQRSDDPEWTQAFIGAMHRGSGQRAPALVSALVAEGLLAGRRRVLDLGGGSGVYCHALLAALPEARATLFDLPEVGNWPAATPRPPGWPRAWTSSPAICARAASAKAMTWPSSRPSATCSRRPTTPRCSARCGGRSPRAHCS
ncbi:helix-turn-helix domain-containing protein [bacterium]|nr:helix-turn-helix domain-containing protein [bacterium]